MGYHRAGFTVVGVDTKKQPRYPFEFHQADALTFPLDGFDVIHASPPCQRYSTTRHTHQVEHPDLIVPIRERLVASGLFYVIENVPGAPMNKPVTICGATMDCIATDDDGVPLVLKRHRLFESNVAMSYTKCSCVSYRNRGYSVAGVYGGGSPNKAERWGGYTPAKHVQEQLIGADWMTLYGLAQAIPPVYTQWIGKHLFSAFRRQYRRG